MGIMQVVWMFPGLLLLHVGLIHAWEGPTRLSNASHKSYYNMPQCIDHPDGYGCECGPGFHWNTKMCMSSAIDSRFEFHDLDPVRYTLLLGKAFPQLDNFTIVFFIKVKDNNHKGTILSYRQGGDQNLIRIFSGPHLTLEINSNRKETNIKLSTNTWYHIAWTYISETGAWELFLNGEFKGRDVFRKNRKRPIPSGGDFVLGQSSATSEYHTYDTSLALLGDITHLHIWDFVLTREEIRTIKYSCDLMYCGNAVQWADMRSGTRGAMRMRWPSGVVTPHCTQSIEKHQASSCDVYCSYYIGAQCNEETIENILWIRTKAEKNQSIPCPGEEDLLELNDTGGEPIAMATRPCYKTDNNDGLWGKPNIDQCIESDLLRLKQRFLHELGSSVEELHLLELADTLLNYTDNTDFTNPIHLATIIDLLEILVKKQELTLKDVKWKTGVSTYGKTVAVYPSIPQTEAFCEIIASIADSLLSRRNQIAWNATRPYGFEADNLLNVMKHFADVVATSLYYHFIHGLVTYKEALVRVSRENIEFKIEHQWIYEFQGTKFPDLNDLRRFNARDSDGFVQVNYDVLNAYNKSDLASTALIGLSTFRYKHMSWTIPNHNLTGKTRDFFEDNVNTALVAAYLHTAQELPEVNFTSPILIQLPFLDTFNVSNPDCVRLVHFERLKKKNRVLHWHWTTDGCSLVKDEMFVATCACHKPGVYAVTTDMYNVNWDKGDKKPVLMNVASYIGCTVSAGLTFISFVALVYYRTSTSSANLHKNLSLAIMFSQLTFMVGIDKYDYPVVCHVFAILLHYFFLASYAWIMNEAFNLYIMITYSAHSHGALSDSGSLVRYYILGWIFPIVLVGAFVGSQGDGYYGKDMCWVAWSNIWLYVGPSVGLICITILVMIFLAKEQNENSYTKSEKTNRIIMIHIKACWTQIILITCCWSFAILSIKMQDGIVKVLYCMFNCLQGAFFIVFYMLLQEEVKARLKASRKKKALILHGYEDQDRPSSDSFSSFHQEKEDEETVPLDPCSPGKRISPIKSPKSPPNREDLKRRTRARTEVTSGEENSDCEMITSV